MRLIFHFVLREKPWLILSIISVLLASSLTLAQAGIFTQFATLLVQMDSTQQKNVSAPPEKKIPAETSLTQKIQFVFDSYRSHGSRGAIAVILEQQSRFFILLFGLAAALILLLLQLFQYAKDFTTNYLAIRVAARFREHFFTRLLYLPSSFFKGQHSGEVLSRSISDIAVVQQELGAVFETLLFAPIMIIGGSVILVRLNAEFALIILITGLVAAGAIHLVTMVLRRYVIAVQSGLADLARHLQEVLYAIDVVKIFGREGYERRRYRETIRLFLKKVFFEHAVLKLIRPLTEFLGALALVAVVLYGADKIWNKTMALDEIFHFLIILVIVSPYLQKAASVLVVRQKLLAVGGRLSEIMDHKPERHEGMSPEALERGLSLSAGLDEAKPAGLTGAVEFRNVSFFYPNAARPSLENFSLSVKPGQMVAVVGSSGSGKSTLLYLVPRLFAPTSGEIFFDGKAGADFPLPRLRAAMAFVSQESLLFPGTIRENILYGKLDASNAEMEAAAKMADIHDFIRTRGKGYDTLVGERGLQLSGGQKQRLAIARAVLRKPKILLLDEATSALDTESERAVQKALEELVHLQTTIVVAHRLSTILKADQIVVLEQGRLVEQGTCEELLKKGGTFKRLYDLQFS